MVNFMETEEQPQRIREWLIWSIIQFLTAGNSKEHAIDHTVDCHGVMKYATRKFLSAVSISG